jgi:protease I
MKTFTQQIFGGLHIGVLVSDGFEQDELCVPRQALEEVGTIVKILAVRPGTVQGMQQDQASDPFTVDLSFDKARADDFDALLLVGGAVNAEALCLDPDAQRLVKNTDKEGKPIGMIGPAAWLLLTAGLVKGRSLTGPAELADDVAKAGGQWIDKDWVVDDNWVSCRRPTDLAAFTDHFKAVLGKRVKASVKGTADDLPGAAGTGG